MTRTAIRHTMFALATASLLIAFTGLTAYAQSATPFMGMKGAAIATSAAISGSGPQTPKGLGTKKGSQQTGAVLPHPIRDYALPASNSR
jgi:hypothetical protein